MKKEATKKIKENRISINENKIKWVLTVPAIWDEKQKGIMIKASEEAGLINQNTDRSNFFALEPHPYIVHKILQLSPNLYNLEKLILFVI